MDKDGVRQISVTIWLAPPGGAQPNSSNHVIMGLLLQAGFILFPVAPVAQSFHFRSYDSILECRDRG
jgi:predicted CoA-binding protein